MRPTNHHHDYTAANLAVFARVIFAALPLAVAIAYILAGLFGIRTI